MYASRFSSCEKQTLVRVLRSLQAFGHSNCRGFLASPKRGNSLIYRRIEGTVKISGTPLRGPEERFPGSHGGPRTSRSSTDETSSVRIGELRWPSGGSETPVARGLTAPGADLIIRRLMRTYGFCARPEGLRGLALTSSIDGS